nr:dihydroxy-acid dehydratase [Cryptosporangium arvum]
MRRAVRKAPSSEYRLAGARALPRAAGVAADGDVAHAYSADGGLAVLRGNLAPDGCVVTTAGVDAAVSTFTGPAVVVAGGVIALVEDGDPVTIDLPARAITVAVDDAVPAARRDALEAAGGYRPRHRDRPVPTALRAYAALVSSADRGAIRCPPG